MYLQRPVMLSSCQLQTIDMILGKDFPWYYQPGSSPTHYYFGHALIGRHPSGDVCNGIVNSPHVNNVMSLFQSFCEQQGIKVNHVFRAAVNLTVRDQEETAVIPHRDHNFDHNVFIMCLNDFDDGDTLLYNDDGSLKHRIKQKKNEAVVFRNALHSIEMCKIGQRRVVFVVTFD